MIVVHRNFLTTEYTERKDACVEDREIREGPNWGSVVPEKSLHDYKTTGTQILVSVFAVYFNNILVTVS
jgi:hypothetical protein